VSDDLRQSRLSRAGVATVIFGFFVFLIGVFPDLIQLGLTPGIGIFQIFTFMTGLSPMPPATAPCRAACARMWACA